MFIPIFVPVKFYFTPTDLINTIKTRVGLLYPFKIVHISEMDPDTIVDTVTKVSQMTDQEVYNWEFESEEYMSVDDQVLVVIKYWTPEDAIQLRLRYKL